MSDRDTDRVGTRGYVSRYGAHDMSRGSVSRISWRFWALALAYEAAVVGLVWYGVTHPR
jgi:hypothetical protein